MVERAPNTAVVAVTFEPDSVAGAAKIFGSIGGGTDCASPALWLGKQKEDYDVLVIFSDNESWAGTRSAAKAIEDYRKERNPELLASCVSTAVNGTKLTEPTDPRSLDIVGFDADTPSLVTDFIKGDV